MLEKLSQCLHCKNAKCTEACPVHTPIGEVITMIQNNDEQHAKEVLFQNNPMSAVCAWICDHKGQCYGHCIRGIKSVSVPFFEAEKEYSGSYLKELHLSAPALPKKRAAVIGAGPAGITCAVLLTMNNIEVTMFESGPEIGGVLANGIPSFRLPKDLLKDYKRILDEAGVAIKYNVTVGKTVTVSKLKEDYDALFIMCGAPLPNTLRIPGENMGHVHYAIDYLKSPESYHLGHHVITLGAGNVAMDAARTLARTGHHSEIYYRKSFNEMKANVDEIEDTKKDGVTFTLFESPVEIKKDGIVFCKSENVTDERGRIVTKILYGTEHFVPCDAVIVAVSQLVDSQIYNNTGIELNKWNTPETDEFGRTNLPFVYAAGDGVTGPKTVAEAVQGAKLTVQAFLQDIEE